MVGGNCIGLYLDDLGDDLPSSDYIDYELHQKESIHNQTRSILDCLASLEKEITTDEEEIDQTEDFISESEFAQFAGFTGRITDVVVDEGGEIVDIGESHHFDEEGQHSQQDVRLPSADQQLHQTLEQRNYHYYGVFIEGAVVLAQLVEQVQQIEEQDHCD